MVDDVAGALTTVLAGGGAGMLALKFGLGGLAALRGLCAVAQKQKRDGC
jgi:hypothetical protein